MRFVNIYGVCAMKNNFRSTVLFISLLFTLSVQADVISDFTTAVAANPANVIQLTVDAIKASPDDAAAITTIAIKAAPNFAVSITSAAITVAPNSAAAITLAAVSAAPTTLSQAIITAATTAAPTLTMAAVNTPTTSTIASITSSLSMPSTAPNGFNSLITPSVTAPASEAQVLPVAVTNDVLISVLNKGISDCGSDITCRQQVTKEVTGLASTILTGTQLQTAEALIVQTSNSASPN